METSEQSDCTICGQPYHRFCSHDPEHEHSYTACINSLQGRIEELEADNQLLARGMAELLRKQIGEG